MTPTLPLCRYRLQFSAVDGHATDFPGCHWRGALGYALRESACLTGAGNCEPCPEKSHCAYSYLFETAPGHDAEKMRLYQQVPHPYALREESAQEGSGPCLVLTLFGHGNAHLSLMVLALARAAAGPRGIGGRRMRLLAVEQEARLGQNDWQRINRPEGGLAPLSTSTPQCPPAPETALRIEIQSPLRAKREGRYVGAREFRFGDLFGNLLRRISMLTAFHSDTPLETDFRGLVDAARAIEAKSDLRWVELGRHSARQKANMKMAGVVGSLNLDAAGLAPFWPYLWLGQFTHAGSAATMGLGYFTLRSASLPDATPAPTEETMAHPSASGPAT
ncbi:MAG: CRISPR system precrRNA processing endoribonuclease RAMP protein Cas6 [Rhodocyclaceae bacterium]|nr:CRISPR system precrRNA processing endoribonuclease RAMP protein Cas6 [Rhodocyclaceae bacterium]